LSNHGLYFVRELRDVIWFALQEELFKGLENLMF
jgi:hypothetical protein